MSWLEGRLFSPDAAALDRRLEAMARAVCGADPRTLEQRRADALGALAQGGDRLGCGCGDPDCDAAGAAPSAVVINVIAEENSLSDDTVVALDGASPPGSGPACTNPAVVLGGGLLPAPLLAGQAGHYRDDPAGDSSRRECARAAVCALGGVGPVCALPGCDVSVSRLR